MDAAGIEAEAGELKQLCGEFGVPFVIDDAVDIAVRAGADGVHVGQEDMEAGRARTLLGRDAIVGVSAETVEEAVLAEKNGADYLGVGAIYPTTTKVKTVLTSTDTLNDICNAVPIPANAIGGLNKDNLGVLKGIPIAGICVVSAIMKSGSPKEAAQGLIKAIDEL